MIKEAIYNLISHNERSHSWPSLYIMKVILDLGPYWKKPFITYLLMMEEAIHDLFAHNERSHWWPICPWWKPPFMTYLLLSTQWRLCLCWHCAKIIKPALSSTVTFIKVTDFPPAWKNPGDRNKCTEKQYPSDALCQGEACTSVWSDTAEDVSSAGRNTLETTGERGNAVKMICETLETQERGRLEVGGGGGAGLHGGRPRAYLCEKVWRISNEKGLNVED